ncbi:hypothetical protein WH265_21075 [Comamonas sp. MYb396]
MPKFACRCGYVMNLSNGSPDFELALVPERCIDEIGEKLDVDNNINSERFFELIDEVKTTVYRCPSCGRVHFDEGAGVFRAFVPEF